MPNSLTIETADKEKPVLLLFGKNPLIDIIINNFKDEFKIAFITANELSEEEIGAVYKINPNSSYLLKELEEKIGYSVFLIGDNDDLKLLRQLAPVFIKDKTKALILFSVRDTVKHISELDFLLKIEGIQIGFLGDLFGAEIPILFSDVSQLIHSATTRKVVIMTGDDLRPIFPISDNDALSGVRHILFGTTKKNKLFYLFYQHPQTIISAIHLIKRREPDLSIEFKDGTSKTEHAKNTEEIESDLYQNSIAKPVFIDHTMKGFEKSISYKSTDREEGKIARKSKRGKINILAYLKFSYLKPFFVAILFYFLIQAVSVGVAQFYAKNAMSALERNDISGASKNIGYAQLFLFNIHPLGKLTKAIFPEITHFPLPHKVLVADEASGLLSDYSEIAVIISKSPLVLDLDSLKKFIASVTYLYLNIENLYHKEKTSFLGKIATHENSKLISILPTLPLVLGYGQEKNYLLLFQNNGELRPTGGFIGSVAELSIKEGRVTNFSIKDVYDLDGQLKAHIEPPFIVRKYLQPHLYLRDSNFPLNFQTSASMSALLYKLEGGKQVDGVVAVDFEVLRKIIDAVGPIELPSYKKTLDDSNAFDFLQNTIDSNFFPGSTEKKKVLTAVFDAITFKLEHDQASQIKVASVIINMMTQKHILFAFNLKSVQNIFSANSLGGEISDQRQKDNSTVYDLAGINEANIGVNKANTSINRFLEYDISFKKEEVDSKATINIYNTGQKSVDYKSYLRVVAPKEAKLLSITIDGKNQNIIKAITDPNVFGAKNFKAPEGLEVLTEQDGNFLSFGFPILVPRESNQIIEVSYSVSTPKTNQSLLPYSFLFIKQPGTNEYKIKLNIHPPQDYTIKEAENSTLENGAINITQIINKDQEYKMQFIKH